MRILHVINYFQPSIGYQETFLAREHQRAGHDVSVVTSDRYYPFVDYEATYMPLLGARIRSDGTRVEEGIRVVRLKSMFEMRYRVWLRGLEETVLSLKPDVVIVHALLANAFRMMKLRRRGASFKLIIDEHLIDLVRQKGVLASCYNLFKKKRLKRNLPHVDKFIGVTRETCALLTDLFAVPKEKISYIPLGADSEQFKFDAGGRRRIREQFNVGERDILLLYVGKFDRSKGFGVVAEAFNHLPSDQAVRLLVVGQGRHQDQQQILTALEVEKRQQLTFGNFVPNSELPPYYSAADICVWGDTISASMLEAMACSRPIVGCDIPAVAERVEYGNGLTYRAGCADDLLAKLTELVRNPGRRREMGRKARQAIEEKYSWTKLAAEFLAI